MTSGLQQKSHLRTMMLIREFEDRLSKRKDHGFQLLSVGEEAVAVGLSANLGANDQLLTGGRSIGPALARGVDPNRLMAELLGKASGTNRGKGGRGHLADPKAGFFGAHAVVGGNISIAAGVALSMQMAGKPGIVAILFGDGASGAGALHETLNLAAIWKLPLLFVCNNNRLSVSTPRSAALAPKQLSDFGLAFGLRCQTLDGMDVNVVTNAVGDAISRIRDGGGPEFIEFVSYRFSSHSTTARETRSAAELLSIRQDCPIVRQTTHVVSSGIMNQQEIDSMRDEVISAVDAAIAFSEQSSYPEKSEVLTDVW